MKRVHSSADRIQTAWLASLLEAANITCVLRNEYLGGAIGELPINESWPEIWVVDDHDAAPAERLITQALQGQSAPGEAWVCDQCGERLDGQFGACWQCGGARPEVPGR